MAKMALIQRELKRDKLVAKYAKKHAEMKAISTDAKRSTGRARGTFQHFGLGRSKIREMAFAGEIPGMVKASW